MIQTHSYAGIEDNEVGIEEKNDYFNVQVLKTLSSSVYSNGAIYGKNLLLQNGEKKEKYYLQIGYEELVEFIIWDDTIDLESIKKIAKTFIPE